MIFHSPFEYHYLWLPLVGIAIGLLGSMIGGGGGFFFLLVLILFFDVPAQIAVATSLAATLPICVVGSVSHYRHGHIDFRMVLFFVAAGIPGAVLGANLTGLMSQEQLEISFGIYLILLATHMYLNDRKHRRAGLKGKTLRKNTRLKKNAKGSVYGFLAGVITGIFGTSGTAPVLAGLMAIRMPIKLVVGTSLLVVLVNTISALATHFLVGKIDLTLVYFLAGGAMIGAFTGPKILSGIKTKGTEGPIRRWYALVLVIFGVILILSSNLRFGN